MLDEDAVYCVGVLKQIKAVDGTPDLASPRWLRGNG